MKEKINTEEIEDRKINIDVAGGGGEYFYAKARINPDETFIVLDPSEKSSEPKLKNLHRLVWKSDVDSRLPFIENSVDEASVNFLMGEIQTKEKGPGTVGDDVGKYTRLLKDIKTVLKDGGKVRIVEPKGNIRYVEKALEEIGFSMTSGPNPLPYSEKYMSKWSKAFYDIQEMSGGSVNDEDSVMPMVIEATISK